MRIVFWFSSDKVVVDDICGECDDSCTESREHTPTQSALFLFLVMCHHDLTGQVTYLNIALFEKIGDLRHASLAAHGSLYNGPGI
jgi:hypothetical protein